jgi:hypothetical protein
MPFVFNGQFADIGWIVGDIYPAPDEGKSNLVLFAHKADTAHLIDFPLLTMQKGTGNDFGIQEFQCFFVASIGGFRTDTTT